MTPYGSQLTRDGDGLALVPEACLHIGSMEPAFLRPRWGREVPAAHHAPPQGWNAHVSAHHLNKEGFPASSASDTGPLTLVLGGHASLHCLRALFWLPATNIHLVLQHGLLCAPDTAPGARRPGAGHRMKAPGCAHNLNPNVSVRGKRCLIPKLNCKFKSTKNNSSNQ